MKKKLVIWQLISKSLQENIPVILLYVLESNGSSPGRAGFCMAVNANGQMAGSIGGGIMEYKFVEMAKVKLKHSVEECKIYKQIHNKESLHDQSGMICSGYQSNLVYRVQHKDIDSVHDVIKCIDNDDNGKLTLSPNGIIFKQKDETPSKNAILTHAEKDDWMYEEHIGYLNTIYIIGSGHCALALSKMMAELGFYVYVYDDRPTLNTFLENSFAHEKKLVEDYAELGKIISAGPNNYVVVMTVGYRTDDIVVKTLLDKEFRFFGLLGSKKKIEKMLSNYKKEGLDAKFLNRIQSPVGLDINSQTPAEIAVSIAAQIIKVKNSGR